MQFIHNLNMFERDPLRPFTLVVPEAFKSQWSFTRTKNSNSCLKTIQRKNFEVEDPPNGPAKFMKNGSNSERIEEESNAVNNRKESDSNASDESQKKVAESSL